MIELKNVSKSYASLSGEINILSDVSLKLPNAGFHVICGRSGCGKTTLFNMIAGVDLEYSGEILYDNVNIKALPQSKQKKFFNNNLNYLRSRDNFIKNITVNKAIYIYLSKSSRKKAYELIKEYNLDYLLKKKIKKLSSGELQKISIIIAVCKNACITLLDEPICNIDSKSVSIYLELIKELSKTSLVLYISHYQNNFDKYFDGVVLLENRNITIKKEASSLSTPTSISCSTHFNLKRSIILEMSKPVIFYTLFRLIIIIIACFSIYVTKLKGVTISDIYQSSLNDMSINIVKPVNTSSEVLEKKKIYYTPLEYSNDIYFSRISNYHTHIQGVGKASDFIFANFNETLSGKEIIISDYLAYKENINVGDEVEFNKLKYEDGKVNYTTKYIIKHIYKTNYASLIAEDNYEIPEEYTYVYISDSEIENMKYDSYYSYGGILLNDSFYVSAYDSKFVECDYYAYGVPHEKFPNLEDDEFYAGVWALSKMGLGDIASDTHTYMYGSDEYYDITFTYNGMSLTKRLKYKLFVNNRFNMVVSQNLMDEIKSYFGITFDDTLNYKEVTTLDINNTNNNSYLKSLNSFDDLIFLNDNILREKYSSTQTILDFYSSNYIYVVLFFAIFLSICMYKIVQIEYEYVKLLKNNNFSLFDRLCLFIISKALVYLIVLGLILLISNFITVL